MNNSPWTAAILISFLAAIPATEAQAASPGKRLPPNTIDCSDWTYNPDRTWTAHANAKPFNVGNTKALTMQGSQIGPHSIDVGGFDLADVLDQKCGQP